MQTSLPLCRLLENCLLLTVSSPPLVLPALPFLLTAVIKPSVPPKPPLRTTTAAVASDKTESMRVVNRRCGRHR